MWHLTLLLYGASNYYWTMRIGNFDGRLIFTIAVELFVHLKGVDTYTVLQPPFIALALLDFVPWLPQKTFF